VGRRGSLRTSCTDSGGCERSAWSTARRGTRGPVASARVGHARAPAGPHSPGDLLPRTGDTTPASTPHIPKARFDACFLPAGPRSLACSGLSRCAGARRAAGAHPPRVTLWVTPCRCSVLCPAPYLGGPPRSSAPRCTTTSTRLSGAAPIDTHRLLRTQQRLAAPGGDMTHSFVSERDGEPACQRCYAIT
jgi:hypothetical protein